MNKIKVIDLLNMISKGEEVPKVIRFGKIIYEYEEGIDYVDGEGLDKKFLMDKICISQEDLNDYVEIIEETKKIEKWGEGALEEMEKCTNYTLEDLQKYIRILAETQNELIDEINNLKDNKYE